MLCWDSDCISFWREFMGIPKSLLKAGKLIWNMLLTINSPYPSLNISNGYYLFHKWLVLWDWGTTAWSCPVHCLLFMNKPCWRLESAFRLVETTEPLQTQPTLQLGLCWVVWVHHCAEGFALDIDDQWNESEEAKVTISVATIKAENSEMETGHPLLLA